VVILNGLERGNKMFKFIEEIFEQDNEFIKNFYGVKITPCPKYKKKLEKAIAYLGENYVLAKHIERVKV
jgi:hypothetical protein